MSSLLEATFLSVTREEELLEDMQAERVRRRDNGGGGAGMSSRWGGEVYFSTSSSVREADKPPKLLLS
ncbi:unnamed protein product [Linum tenue]|uniref:Uncharacterized protein n=1 Tax=Linum tenue TaxID=586396 RepID=A0AAV0IAS7_9ROSI|nr:unnamed protein product [Linum tenue]